MVDLQDDGSLLEPEYHNVRRFPLSPETSQPFLFRQYSVSEFITPSKQGNVSLKEISLTVSSTSSWSPHYFGGRNSEASTSQSLPTHGEDQGKNMIKSLWATQAAQADHSEKHDGKLLALPNQSGVLRSRHKNSPASKRMKIDPGRKGQNISHPNLKHIRKDRIKNEQRVKSLHWKYVLMISLLPLLSLSCIIYLASPLLESDIDYQGRNFQELADILKGNVVGQDEPIRSLLSILNSLLNKDFQNADDKGKMPVIVMTGSSGVGKSFVSSIVASNFPLPGKTELVLLPLPSPENVFQKFSRNVYNLVVVDSLNPDSSLVVRKWVQNIDNESKWQKKPLIVILVFNVQMWHGDFESEGDNILLSRNLRLMGDTMYASLKTSGFDLYHIHFNLLTKNHIQECIRRDLRKQGVTNNIAIENYVEVITRNINIKHDGCKPVWSQTASVASD